MNYLKYLTSKDILKLLIPLAIIGFAFIFKLSVLPMLDMKISRKIPSPSASIDNILRVSGVNYFRTLIKYNLNYEHRPEIYKLRDSRFVNSLRLEHEPEIVVKAPDNIDNKTPEIPEIKLSSIFLGQRIRYATIDGKLLKKGDELGKEKLIKIEPGRILLAGPWGKRWIYVSY